MDVLGAADAEREDAPFSLGVLRVKLAPVSVGIEVLEGLFVEVPVVGGIDPATIAAVVWRADEKFPGRCEDAPRFFAKLNQVDRKMLDEILGHDDLHGIVVPGPGYVVQVEDNIGVVAVFDIDVNVAVKSLGSCPQV
jgi:hypothetical protein